MPASSPRSSSEDHPAGLRADERGVSEIVGYILTFAILSTVLLIAMLTFGAASREAEQRVREVEAASLAHRVAAALVEADLYRSQAGAGLGGLFLRVEVASSLREQGFSIETCLAPTGAPSPDECGAPTCLPSAARMDAIRVSSGSVSYTESLLGAQVQRSCVASGELAIALSPPPGTACKTPSATLLCLVQA